MTNAEVDVLKQRRGLVRRTLIVNELKSEAQKEAVRKILSVTEPEPLSTPESVYRHRAESGTTNTPAKPRPLFCEVMNCSRSAG